MSEISDDVEFTTPDGSELTPAQKLAALAAVDRFLDGDSPAPAVVHRRLVVVPEQA